MERTERVYFLGIGGIGMSAIASHYRQTGVDVAGYDRTPSNLTRGLEAMGAAVTYTDDADTIPLPFRSPDGTLVIITPAIPADSQIWAYFRNGGYRIEKRAVALGELTRPMQTYCVAGTHGKTTTSTLIAHILRQSRKGCTAFLGGVSVNYDTNYWGNASSDIAVTEADEYDRSFLQLSPTGAVITAMDPDHLDIYGTHAEMIKSFLDFAANVKSGGMLLVKKGLPVVREDVAKGVTVSTYALLDPLADYHAERVVAKEGRYEFDICTPSGKIDGVRLGVPGFHNVENAVAATAMALRAGATAQDVKDACLTFRGDRRRFEIKVETPTAMVIDDYAHHPQEIRTTIESVRSLYPGRRLTVAFQPHLYTRTRDLADDFAEALSQADRTWLIDIYPAREKPIPGVTSAMLLEKMKSGVGRMSTKDSLADDIASESFDIVVVMGAGDIDRLVPQVAKRVAEESAKA